MTEHAAEAPHADAYDGPATLVVGGAELPVEVRLRGHVEPIDGRFHWYGRIQPCPELDAVATPGGTGTVRTPRGEAAGRLSDIDPWGRFRIAGLGRPPF
ncbi:MAG: DUF4873 domain-containing protein [Marmoricola sp.]